MDRPWLLVVEPCDRDRELIRSASLGVLPDLHIEFLDDYEHFVGSIAKVGRIPKLAIFDWFAGNGPHWSLQTLESLGFRDELPIVAVAGDDAIRALDESYELGIPRFISKRPDAACFKKKIREVVSEYLGRPKPAGLEASITASQSS